MLPRRFPSTTRYQYVRTLGRGGMGAVFEAFDRELGRSVALKTVLEFDSMGVELFIDEFRARQRVTHPGLLQMLELVVGPEQCFFTMELLDAVELTRWITVNSPSLQAPTEPLAPIGDTRRTEAPAPMQLHASQRELLARSAGDVVSALHALHQSGLVHRDVKPSNILVTTDGRTVLADFGLTTSFTRMAGEPKREQVIAGTVGYLAPEAMFGATTEATDIYSLGASLYSIFMGAAPDPVCLDTSRKKLRMHCGDDRWASLVVSLLDPEPERRPSAAGAFEALSKLAGAAPLKFVHDVGLRIAQPTEPPSRGAPFVGREGELRALEQGFDDARRHGRCVVMHVSGTSGIGKTTLVREALERYRVPDLLVLRGRCHPDEQVPFGGFEQVVAELRSHLLASETQPISREARSALCTVFPRLDGVWTKIHETGDTAASPPRRVVQRRAFQALRSLLTNVAADVVLVIWLEDAHWMGPDSRALLDSLLAEGSVPNATFVLSYRPDAAMRELSDMSAVVRPQSGESATAHHRHVDLMPLADSDVLQLLHEIGVGDDALPHIQELVDAAQGIPIFADVLGRHAKGASRSELRVTTASDTPLVHVLQQQMRMLDGGQLGALSVVALSPRPLRRELLLSVGNAMMSPADIVHLTHMGFLRSTPVDGRQRITVFHDRVRQARLAGLGEDKRVALHQQLAEAYETSEPTAFEALTHHLAGALRFREAAGYALRAADGAERQLAFGTAATLYQRALAWMPNHPERGELTASLAEARANQGVGDAAGRRFEEAAATIAQGGGTKLRCTELLTRAAEQYFHCGRVQDGYRVLRDVMDAFELRLPTSRVTCAASGVWLRLARVMRGVTVRTGEPPPLDGWTAARLDALWMACTSLAHINHSLSDVLTLMHLDSALRAGAAHHTFRALTLEAAAEATLGGRWFDRRSAKLLRTAERLVAPRPTAYDRGWLSAVYAACSFFGARWKNVIRHASDAEEQFLRHRVGVSWERGVNHMYWLFALALMGDVEGLAKRHEVAFRDARERGDALAQNTCRSGYSVLVWLYRGDLASARREAAQLMDGDRWLDPERARRAPWPEGGFCTPDYHNLLARTLVHLYAGEACEAYRGMRSAWPHVRAAMLLMVEFVGVDLRYLLARSALAARAQVLAGAAPAAWPAAWNAQQLLDEARVEARILARSANRAARPYALVIRGACDDSVRGHRHVVDAARAFDSLGMRLHAEAARRRLGQASGCSDALARMLVPLRVG